MAEKKYYWLKLKRDFFKRHDIRIIEEMPNGKDYILFYLKMLVESVDHEGGLRFNDTIPYSDEMLSVITNTNIDIVRSAMQVFTQYGMIEVLDNGTIYMAEVLKMIGSAADNDNAIRQQRFRDKKKNEKVAELSSGETENQDIATAGAVFFPNVFYGDVTKSNASVTQPVTNNNESKSIEKELEKELELDNKESKPKKTRFVPPTVEEVRAYCDERGNDVDPEKFVAYYTSNGWRVGRNPMKDYKAAIRTWEKNSYGKPVNYTNNNFRSGGNEFTALLESMGDSNE